MKKQNKVKPPRPPRCLCNSVFHWALGIVSPSKYFDARFCLPKTNRERDAVERYFAALRAYEELIWQQRLAARSVTKAEWKAHHRQQRIVARQQRADESMRKALQQLAASARQVAEQMQAAVVEALADWNAEEKEVE